MKPQKVAAGLGRPCTRTAPHRGRLPARRLLQPAQPCSLRPASPSAFISCASWRRLPPAHPRAGQTAATLADLPAWRVEALTGCGVRDMGLYRTALTHKSALPLELRLEKVGGHAAGLRGRCIASVRGRCVAPVAAQQAWPQAGPQAWPQACAARRRRCPAACLPRRLSLHGWTLAAAGAWPLLLAHPCRAPAPAASCRAMSGWSSWETQCWGCAAAPCSWRAAQTATRCVAQAGGAAWGRRRPRVAARQGPASAPARLCCHPLSAALPRAALPPALSGRPVPVAALAAPPGLACAAGPDEPPQLAACVWRQQRTLRRLPGAGPIRSAGAQGPQARPPGSKQRAALAQQRSRQHTAQPPAVPFQRRVATARLPAWLAGGASPSPGLPPPYCLPAGKARSTSPACWPTLLKRCSGRSTWTGCVVWCGVVWCGAPCLALLHDTSLQQAGVGAGRDLTLLRRLLAARRRVSWWRGASACACWRRAWSGSSWRRPRTSRPCCGALRRAAVCWAVVCWAAAWVLFGGRER